MEEGTTELPQMGSGRLSWHRLLWLLLVLLVLGGGAVVVQQLVLSGHDIPENQVVPEGAEGQSISVILGALSLRGRLPGFSKSAVLQSLNLAAKPGKDRYYLSYGYSKDEVAIYEELLEYFKGAGWRVSANEAQHGIVATSPDRSVVFVNLAQRKLEDGTNQTVVALTIEVPKTSN